MDIWAVPLEAESCDCVLLAPRSVRSPESLLLPVNADEVVTLGDGCWAPAKAKCN